MKYLREKHLEEIIKIFHNATSVLMDKNIILSEIIYTYWFAKTAITTLSYLFETSKEINFLGRPLKPIYEKIWWSMTFDNEKKFKKNYRF